MDGLPPLTSRGETGCKAFIANENSWWGHHTDCIKFSKRADRSRRRFNHQVQTDGVSVSVLMFQLHVESPAASSTTPSAPPASKKRKRQEQSVIEWVQGLLDRHLIQPQRIVGLDPGRRALFTTLVHSARSQPTACKKSVHVSTDMTVCLGAAADGRRPLASSTGCTRQTCGSAENQTSTLLY